LTGEVRSNRYIAEAAIICFWFFNEVQALHCLRCGPYMACDWISFRFFRTGIWPVFLQAFLDPH
jgi:hypothetical protein